MKFKVVALVMLVGTIGMAVSCQKEQIVKQETVSTEVGVVKVGEDDDLMIKGKVKKSNQSPVFGAQVETYNYMTKVKVAETFTNHLGIYEQKVPTGLYYLKVTNPNSGNVVYSSVLRIDTINLLNDLDFIVD